VEELRKHDAIRIVQAAELKGALAEMLEGGVESRALGARGREVFERESGATERSVKVLIEVLAAHPEPVEAGSR
jgi:3-deoxy-D-manno-octulosonic-acid transferase